MKNNKDLNITIIGFGFLMSYLHPCYTQFFTEGDQKDHIIAVTADAETPICNFKGSLPFMHSVSVDSCTDFIVDCSVHSESCSYTLSDDLTVSIRATAGKC